MRQLNAINHLDDSVGSGFVNCDCVSRTIGDVDECPRFMRRGGVSFCSRTSDPIGNCQPVRIILGLELVTAGMERITPRFGRQRMDQQTASAGVSGDNVLQNILIIALRLVRGPIRGSWLQLFQVKASVVFRMTAVSPASPRPSFRKNGSYP